MREVRIGRDDCRDGPVLQGESLERSRLDVGHTGLAAVEAHDLQTAWAAGSALVRNMSFMLTTRQMRAREKDVTRRCAWWNLRPGDKVMAVEKGQGLKAGEKVKRIGTVRILAVRRERLDAMISDEAYGRDECRREGFPEMHPMEFITMFCASHTKCRASTIVNRIEFEYL